MTIERLAFCGRARLVPRDAGAPKFFGGVWKRARSVDVKGEANEAWTWRRLHTWLVGTCTGAGALVDCDSVRQWSN
jgi:hypothetical protein